MGKTWLILSLALLLSGCGSANTIPIGFMADLSGNTSDLGVQGRNAVEMAVNQINEAGGINGKTLILIVEDCGNSEEGIADSLDRLLSAQVAVVIGPMTSSQTAIAKEIMDQTDTLMISPTASSVSFSGLDDQLLRMVSTNAQEAAILSSVAVGDGITSVAIIRDGDNDAYTGSYERAFTLSFEEADGWITNSISFSSASHPDFEALIAELTQIEPEGVLIISSSLDTAIIAQRLYNNNPDYYVYTSGWAYTANSLIPHGGRAVENMRVITSSSSCGEDYPTFREFRDAYFSYYKQEPTNPAQSAYEAMIVLKEAFQRNNGRGKDLKEVILDIGRFEGLRGDIVFDENGDLNRQFCLLVIQNGEYVPFSRVGME